MDEELSEMLRVWGERGPALISAVLEERKRLLDLAALHRDDLSSQLFEAQNEITLLREQAREQERQHQNEKNQSAATIKQLTTSISSLTKELQDVKSANKHTENELARVTKERDKAISDMDQRERSTENIMAALQKSMHSEAKAKSTARDSILNLRQENIEYSHLVVSHQLKAEKEARRADAAEKKALELQERLDKILTEKSITSEDTSRKHDNQKQWENAHLGIKRKFASSSKSEITESAVVELPSEVTQDDEFYIEPPTKRRLVSRPAGKRKSKVVHTVEKKSDEYKGDESLTQCESRINTNDCDKLTRKRVVRKNVERRKNKEKGTTEENSDDIERGQPYPKPENEEASEPHKTHELRKRKTKPLHTTKSVLLRCEKKPSQPGFDPSHPTSSKHERPRRNLPKVSYIYPLDGDSDVQPNDSLCMFFPKAQK